MDSQWQVQYRYGADGERAIKYGTSGARQSETLYFNRMLQIGYGETTVYGGATESKHIYVGETRIVTKHRGVGNIDMGQEEVRQYYYHGDHLGSAQVVTNVDGELYEHIEYTPYGELWIEHTTEEGNLLPFRFTAKEYDRETGLYYYGARYLDPRTSRWISTDPAMGEYIPGAPINDEAREHNKNLPGMGGVFNYVNLHVYHYAGNNPIKLVDPDGEDFYNFTDEEVIVRTENGSYVPVPAGQMYEGKIDGVILHSDTIGEETVVKVTAPENIPVPTVHLVVMSSDNGDEAYIVGSGSTLTNDGGDTIKRLDKIFKGKDEELSGVYGPAALKKYDGVASWVEGFKTAKNNENGKRLDKNNPNVREMTFLDKFVCSWRFNAMTPLRERD